MGDDYGPVGRLTDFWSDMWWNHPFDPAQAVFDYNKGDQDSSSDSLDTKEVRAKRGILALGVVAGAVAAPSLYAAYLGSRKGRKKRTITPAQERLGMSLENTSQQATTLTMTALASPAIALPIAYWLIELAENYPPRRKTNILDYSARNAAMATARTLSAFNPIAAEEAMKSALKIEPAKREVVLPPGIISGKFGNTMQGLLTATVAAPIIQGIASAVGSAFKGKVK